MTGNFTISVRKGQTASELAQIYGVNVNAIPKDIKAGQNITIPLNFTTANVRKEKENDEMQAANAARHELEYTQSQLQEYKLKNNKTDSNTAKLEQKIDSLEDKVNAQMHTGSLTQSNQPILQVFGKTVLGNDVVTLELKKNTEAGKIKELYNLIDGVLRPFITITEKDWGVDENGAGYKKYDEKSIIPKGTKITLDKQDFKK